MKPPPGGVAHRSVVMSGHFDFVKLVFNSGTLGVEFCPRALSLFQNEVANAVKCVSLLSVLERPAVLSAEILQRCVMCTYACERRCVNNVMFMHRHRLHSMDIRRELDGKRTVYVGSV